MLDQLIKQLKEFDTALFLFLNSHHNAFFDFIMYWASDRFIWIPFYAMVAFFLIRIYKTKFLLVALMIVLLIVLSDQISANFIKTTVHRLRPCHNMFIAHKIHLLNNNCGGKFGFVSSHASSVFGFATFISLIVRGKIAWLKFVLIPWAFFVSYSRIYLGVHYPGDIIGGAMLGVLLAYMVFFLYTYLVKRGNKEIVNKSE